MNPLAGSGSRRPSFWGSHGAGSCIAMLLVGIVSLQCGSALAKQLFPLLGATGTVTLRVVFSALALLLLRRPWRRARTEHNRLALVGYGLSVGLMNLGFYLALQHIPLGVTVALEFCGPLAIALAGSRRLLDVVWVVLAVTGLALLLPLSGGTAALDLRGVGYALAAGVCWAIYILLGQRAGHVYGSDTAALGSMVAVLLVLPMGIHEAGMTLLRTDLWLWGLGVALLSTALPYTIEIMVMTRLPARVFGILMSLEPAVASVVGVLLLGEHLSLHQVGAILAIIFASFGAALGARREQV